VLRYTAVDDLNALFPRGVLYGPYAAVGRTWMQWMARGPGLACDLLPAVEPVLSTGVDPHVLRRLELMKDGAGPALAAVRQREQGVPHYRPPREKLTIVG
jgi:hypothetical protein